MNFSLGGVKRVLLVSLATVTMSVSLAACTDDKPDPKPSASVPADSPADKASDAFQRFWDTQIQIANSGEVNSAAFDGIARGPFLELVLKSLSDQADGGVVRVGKPTFSEYDTTVKGDSATSFVCVDEAKWGATVDGEPIPNSTSDTPEPRPFVATLQLTDGAWIVTNVESKEGAACP